MQTLAATVFSACIATGAAACPDTSLTPLVSYGATGLELETPRLFDGVAGGETYIFNCELMMFEGAGGYYASPADFSFTITGLEGRRLEFSTKAEEGCDPQLLIMSANSFYYDDDDGGGLDARVTLTRPTDGTYFVWIGSFDPEYCRADLLVQAT